MDMFADLRGSINKIKLTERNSIFSIYEAVVNSIQSKSKNIEVNIKTKEVINPQTMLNLNNEQKENEKKIVIEEINIVDDGEGFTSENFNSFNRINSTHKIKYGGKGVGRLTWLKVFKNILIKSYYKENSEYYYREFTFDLNNGIKEICCEKQNNMTKKINTTISFLEPVEKALEFLPISIEIYGEKILYHCLSYLIEGVFEITISDGMEKYYCKRKYRDELEKDLKTTSMHIKEHKFELIYIPIIKGKITKHEIALTANAREVKRKSLSSDELLSVPFNIEDTEKFILAYVKGEYLDLNVTEDRTDFLFSKNDGDLFLKEKDICDAVSEEIIDIFDQEVEKILEENKKNIEKFLVEEPYYRSIYNLDQSVLKKISPKSKKDTIEDEFEKIAKEKRREVKSKIKRLEFDGEYGEKFSEIVEDMNKLNQYELSKYVVHRKLIIEFLEKILQKKEKDNNYFYEKDLHNLVFPMKKFGNQVNYEEHNLWLIDDRLSYHKFLSSDKPFSEFCDCENIQRMDIGIFDNPIAFSDKSIEEQHTNVIIIEFKRPGREDLNVAKLNEQFFSYIETLKENEVKNFNGMRIEVGKNSIFNVYVVCELNASLIKSLEMNGYKRMIDGQGYYFYNDNYNTFIQILSLNKVLRDSKMRNKIFFEKLGI